MNPITLLLLTTTVPEPPVVSSETAISLATVFILITAAWRISWLLSRIDSRTDGLPEKVTRLETAQNETKQEVALMKQHLETLEGDVNNLWAAFRGDDPAVTRRERPPRIRS